MHSVIVRLSSDRVSVGHYKIEDGVLSMVFADGRPVLMGDGSPMKHIMRPEDNAKSIAAVLTREVRKALRGDSVPGFGDDLDYPEMGTA